MEGGDFEQQQETPNYPLPEQGPAGQMLVQRSSYLQAGALEKQEQQQTTTPQPVQLCHTPIHI